MNPQEDPEARIRSLEPTEQGVERQISMGYGATAPLPPPPNPQWPYIDPSAPGTYRGAPYPPAPPPASTRGRSLVVLVPLTVLVLMAAGAVAGYLLLPGRSTHGTPGIAGGGGQFVDDAGSPPARVRPPTETPPARIPALPAPGSTLIISGLGSNKTVDCNDGVVIISGANNTVRVTGHCISVTVSGFENIVTVDSADKITASGFDNRVTFQSGSPEVTESGSGNAVAQG